MSLREKLSHPLAGFALLLTLAAAGNILDHPGLSAFAVIVGGLFLAMAGFRQKRMATETEQAVHARENLHLEMLSLRRDLDIEQARREQILQNMADGLFYIDLQSGGLIDINRRAEEMLGYSRNEIETIHLQDLFPRPHRYRFWRLVARVRGTGQAEEVELQFRRRDGSLFIGLVQASIATLGERQVVHGSFRDVTPAVNLNLELRRHNRHLSLLNEISQRVAEGRDLPTTLKIILDQVIDSLDISGGGIFLLHNQGTEMELAIHRAIPQSVLRDLEKIQPGEGLAGVVAATGRPRLSTDLKNDHRRLSQAVADDNWHAFLAVPMIAAESTLGVLFIFDRSGQSLNREDVRLMQAIGRQVGPLVRNVELISELRWQQRLNEASTREIERSRLALREHLDQLEQSHRMLESLDQMKSTFLALASHELRTPLTSILSGTELLEQLAGADLDSAGTRALSAIRHGGDRLKRIVDDLLEAARLEAKALYLAGEFFDPRPLIEGLLADYDQTLDKRQLTCRLESFPAEVWLSGDAHHLQRALGRLLENAVKFTPEGGRIRLTGQILPWSKIEPETDRLRPFSPAFFDHPAADRYLEISIDDSGIGFDPSEQVKIFDKFYEVGDIASHSTSQARFGGKGVGLGLTLAKGVIEAHDGLIWAESAGAQQGSRFSVLLPITERPEKAHG